MQFQFSVTTHSSVSYKSGLCMMESMRNAACICQWRKKPRDSNRNMFHIDSIAHFVQHMNLKTYVAQATKDVQILEWFSNILQFLHN
jgi:hypothetical protein